ncbi:hypothetical protein GGX14DRAFT_476410 [Mycena pura]|uniref:Uncharacterized protein n=1 Tax=Mycena pura TaxID=153505 RepID=A0AAD6Y1B9_9AGAR|nr:hypothetical protein GGX14DRAFT_476410 [Mycena pura]
MSARHVFLLQPSPLDSQSPACRQRSKRLECRHRVAREHREARRTSGRFAGCTTQGRAPRRVYAAPRTLKHSTSTPAVHSASAPERHLFPPCTRVTQDPPYVHAGQVSTPTPAARCPRPVRATDRCPLSAHAMRKTHRPSLAVRRPLRGVSDIAWRGFFPWGYACAQSTFFSDVTSNHIPAPPTSSALCGMSASTQGSRPPTSLGLKPPPP